jgi:hypothetical protein
MGEAGGSPNTASPGASGASGASSASAAGPRSRGARIATWAILGVHAALLLWALPDYRVSIDSGYHVSLARLYAAHGTAYWDPINYGPGGRPNLQGPALHMAIALLGRLFGGSGDAFVLANAVLGVLQWAAAMWTALFFARKYGGDWGALFAVALVAGNALASGSFAQGIPSGWIFILTPWAIHFFLEERLALAGYATAPAGILAAALLGRRWRSLVWVGAATVALTAPYSVHFLRHREWFRGEHGHVALVLAPLLYLLAAPGLVWLLRRPGRHVFLLAWFVAPVAWLFQDYTRFLAQATLAMAVVGGLWAASVRGWLSIRLPARATATLVVVFVALTILPSPLNFPSLLAEGAWVAGIRYPRPLDWQEARTGAGAIVRAGLADRLVNAYNPSECSGFAVYAPLHFEKGHWVEVQPRKDPANALSAGVKVYVLPLAPTDPTLLDLQRRGLLVLHGGSAVNAVATLTPQPPLLAAVVPVVTPILAGEAAWLAAHAENNVLAPLDVIRSSTALQAWRQAHLEQRTHAGRLEIATALYAYALEPANPAAARTFRGFVRGFGSLANFLGDEEAIGFVDNAHHQLLRHNLATVAALAAAGTPGPPGAAGAAGAAHPSLDTTGAGPLEEALEKLFDEYFTAA